MHYQTKKIGYILVWLLTFVTVQSWAGTPYFTDISVSSGVNVSHSSDTFAIGQAWIDIDNDGDLDIYVTNQLGPNHLLINQGDETFQESSVFANLQLADQACVGVSVADFDNDGWDDIYVNCHGDNHLFKNNQGQAFVDVTDLAQVNDTNNSQVSAWADINNDGWLDLYVVNYNNGQSSSVVTSSDSKGINAAKDSFFVSNGDATFTNINADFDSVNLEKPGLAVTFFDYDNDGDQDLYVVIDRLHGNVLWRNDGPATASCGTYWCFTDVSKAANADAHVYGMGIATGDIDLDGDMDMYFSSIGEQVLLINQTSQGQAVFVDVSAGSVLNVADTAGWGTLFFDYDNDSYLDAMIATYGSTVDTAEKLFKGNGDATFTDVTVDSGVSDLVFTEGIAFGDMNNDGLLDLLKGNRSSGYKLYKNNLNSANNWIEIKLVGYGAVNRNAIGSRVELLTSDGKTLIREVTSGDARGSGNQRALHFGLADATVVSVTVLWSDGMKEEMNDMSHNHRYTLWNQAGRVIFSNGFE
ncbi:MAG: CRTAC1 family protein [Alcanivoracaceae bacterium]|nr:CRTAC1 family protein [Alcanivoracaceae bacterium]